MGGSGRNLDRKPSRFIVSFEIDLNARIQHLLKELRFIRRSKICGEQWRNFGEHTLFKKRASKFFRCERVLYKSTKHQIDQPKQYLTRQTI